MKNRCHWTDWVNLRFFRDILCPAVPLILILFIWVTIQIVKFPITRPIIESSRGDYDENGLIENG